MRSFRISRGSSSTIDPPEAFCVPPLLWNINYKRYSIFGAFNAASPIHMTLLAPETKGYAYEEMDDIFNLGQPVWKTHTKTSRLDALRKKIWGGHKLKTSVPGYGRAAEPTMPIEEKVVTPHA